MAAYPKALAAPCLLGLLVAAAAPPPALAQSSGGTTTSMAYHIPAGWSRQSIVSPANVFVIRDGDKIHTLAIQSVSPKTATEVEPYAASQIASERQRGAEVVDEGATTICDGQPAHRWTVRSASTGIAMETHILAAAITGGIATATYVHRQDVGDRKDALDAMTTLCPGPYPSPVPAGWTAPKNRTAAVGSIDSPDGTSTFVTAVRPMDPDKFPAYEREASPSGTVLADHRDPCSSGTVHRIDVQIGNQIAEVSVGFLHRFAYRYVYTRPATHEADPGAERALTAFCRPSAPVPAGSASPI
jgi:hypothetical protein